MCCSLPVPRSLALTLTIPLASMSKVTSICGTPLLAGAIPSRVNLPRVILSLAICLSPWSTWISTEVWLSAAVVNTCDFLVGIVVFLSISLVVMLPIVSIPRESGVTSSSNKSFTSPDNTPPWIAAPRATHSSGLISFWGCFPVNFLIHSCTAGILVEPPTRRTLSISLAESPASESASLTGPSVIFTRSAVNSSNLARVKSIFKWSGPACEAVINGRLILVDIVEESSFLAFSAASLSLCRLILSAFKSIPFSFLNSSAI